MSLFGKYSMPLFANSFTRDILVRFSLLLGLFVNLGMWVIITMVSGRFANDIALHYTIYFGIDLLGPWYQLYLTPAIGLGILVVNSVAAFFAYRREVLLAYFLMVSSLGMQIILAMSLGLVLYITQ